MKITRSQFKEIIREEILSLNEVDMRSVIDLFSYTGTNPRNYDDSTVERYGQDVVDTAKKVAVKLNNFEKSAAQILKKIKNDKMYPVFLQMIQSADEYGGSGGRRRSLPDVVDIIARKNGI